MIFWNSESLHFIIIREVIIPSEREIESRDSGLRRIVREDMTI